MAVTVYKSTDGSAPVLNGTAGSLVTVLDAILVNGYGAKAAAGWAIAFTGANKRIYRAPSGLLRAYYRVQDDAPNPTFAGGREARLRASEAASAIDTQTVLFPTAVQLPSGIIARKSDTADATANPWIAIADARTLYFFAKTGDYGAAYSAFMFGEHYSLKSTADNYNGLIIGRVAEQVAATPTMLPAQEVLNALAAPTTAVGGHYVPRSWQEFSPTAVNVGKHGNASHSVVGLLGLMMYPNPTDAGLYLSQVWLSEPGGNFIMRGRMRGFWHFLHPVGVGVNDGDTWSGTGPLTGKTFIAIKPTADGMGVFVMETSDTWETN
jgi:hypothetical protein